ncbi:MAG: hypothetical protein BGP25_05585 [Lysobacterales bacterium 63-13]|nr:MAG: hypothetical protein BGP25_05585 [Xanthomonadales bacterium 63-13]
MGNRYRERGFGLVVAMELSGQPTAVRRELIELIVRVARNAGIPISAVTNLALERLAKSRSVSRRESVVRILPH